MKIMENCKTCEWHKDMAEMREKIAKLRGENAELTHRLFARELTLAALVMAAVVLLLLYVTAALAHRADAKRLDAILSKAPVTAFYDNEGNALSTVDEDIIGLVGNDVDCDTPSDPEFYEAIRKGPAEVKAYLQSRGMWEK